MGQDVEVELREPVQVGTNIRGEPILETDPVRERAADALSRLRQENEELRRKVERAEALNVEEAK